MNQNVVTKWNNYHSILYENYVERKSFKLGMIFWCMSVFQNHIRTMHEALHHFVNANPQRMKNIQHKHHIKEHPC